MSPGNVILITRQVSLAIFAEVLSELCGYKLLIVCILQKAFDRKGR
jgi:hypothetical protein